MLFALCTSCLEQVNTKTVTVMHFFHGRHFAVGPLGCCNRKQRVNRHGEDYSRKIAEYHHYWTSLRTNNVSSEGFNNKIWWLIRQGYGSRAIFYLRLKIFQLLSLHPQKVLYVMAQTGEKASTAQRFAVYAYILGNKEHPDVDDVLKCVRKRIPSITRESVLRILMEFSDRGIIYRMDKIVNARFDGIARNHGHFICRECGAIQDFELPLDLPEPDNNPGFQADHVELRISGICAECAKKART